MNGKILMGVVVIFGILATLYGCGERPSASLTAGSPKFSTIPLGFAWDVETDSVMLSRARNTDFLWHTKRREEKHLTTLSIATAAVVKDRDFEEITAEDISRRPLRPSTFEQSEAVKDLDVGTVVVFKTVEGNLGKMIVEGYESLEDVNFPEAAVYPEKLVQRVKDGIESRQDSHLRVKWRLYRPKEAPYDLTN